MMKTPSQKAFEAWAFSSGGEKPRLNLSVETIYGTPAGYEKQQIAMLWYAWQAGRDYGYQLAIESGQK